MDKESFAEVIEPAYLISLHCYQVQSDCWNLQWIGWPTVVLLLQNSVKITINMIISQFIESWRRAIKWNIFLCKWGICHQDAHFQFGLHATSTDNKNNVVYGMTTCWLVTFLMLLSDVAKKQCQNMQKNFTWIKFAFLKPILDWFSHMTNQIKA